ncbi:MAG TPA: helix-hairpin-helix domain-containing protein [Mycobacterium sp.]|nr:helix-hairpin-helix domain-containing protein [Mycobacterium sp.]
MLLIAGLGIAVLVSAFSSGGVTTTIAPAVPSGASPSGSQSSTGTAAGSSAALFVHILGAVAKPGLYQLHDGARAVDAVAAAGGFTADADRQQLNLARLVSDGEQIYVPKVGEAGAGPPGSVAGGGAGASGGKVNINTASESDLETLPRVGPAMAKRIIAWRQDNGRFATVEDLMSVTGIGEKTFAELKDLVTV